MKTRGWGIIAILMALLLVKIICRQLTRSERERQQTEIPGNKERKLPSVPVGPEADDRPANPPSPSAVPGRDALNRQAGYLIYTRHAKCRMACRHIDKEEVEEILREGEINYQKSDLRAHPDPKYAVEGLTHDGQRVRIIFANSTRGVVVVTVIDLGTEWTCHCD